MAQCHRNGWVRLFFVSISSLVLLSGCQPRGLVNRGLDIANISIGSGVEDSVESDSMNRFTLATARLDYGDDFDDEDYDYGWSVEDEESQRFLDEFERSHMVHRRAMFDIRGGGFFPIDPDIDSSVIVGFTAAIEAYKNLYLGIGFDYTNSEVNETASDVLDQFNAGQGAQAQVVADQLDPEQWFEDMDRYSVLFLFEYDVPIFEEKETALVFRGGVGVGVIIIDGQTVSNTFAKDIESREYVNFQARPKVGIYYRFFEHYSVFFDIAYDYVPAGALTIEGRLFSSQRTKIEGDVDFSGFSILGGFGFNW